MRLQGVDPALERQLVALIDSNRLPHAIVIEGGTAAARTALAQELAMARLCTASEQKPCRRCAVCKKVKAKAHPDVFYLTPEKDKKLLAVKQIRWMRTDAYVLPNDGDCKVYLIPEAEKMTPACQDALLKVLEEPPQFSSFILCCESKSVLLETVLSRVAVFHLPEETGEKGSKKKRAFAEETAVNLAAALVAENEFQLLSATAVLEKKGEELLLVLDQLSLIVRDALVLRAGSTHLLSGHPEAAEPLSRRYDSATLLAVKQALTRLSEDTARAANKNLTVTRLCSSLMTAVKAS